MIFHGDHLPQSTAAERKVRDRAFEKWAAEERARIAKQRRVLTAQAGKSRSADRLIALMLERAWVLLDAGEAEAADAILEFVPAEQADALSDEFFKEELP